MELRQQLSQLNIPLSPSQSGSASASESPSHTRPGTGNRSASGSKSSADTRARKSNLYSPYPPNLPLALLRLMESYVVGLAEVSKEDGGWAEAKRERGLALIKSLTQHLGHAERLSSSESFPTSPTSRPFTLWFRAPSSEALYLSENRDMPGVGLTTIRPPTSSPHDPLDRLIADLPSCDPTFTHVRSARMDARHHVSNCRMVFPGLGSISSGCRRGIWSIR